MYSNPLLYAATVMLGVVIINFIVSDMLRRYLGLIDNFSGKMARAATHTAALYVSMCLAAFGMDYGFRTSHFRASVHETNQIVRGVLQWARRL